MKYFLLLALPLMAQPTITSNLEIRPQQGGSVGTLRFYEQRANGSNFAGWQARTSISGNCMYEISDIALAPCSNAAQTLGLSGSREWASIFSGSATLSGSGGSVLSIPTSTASNAINVASGGVTASQLVAGTSITSFGTIRVGPTIPGLITVIDNSANLTTGDIAPTSASVRNIGTALNRYAGVFGDKLYAYATGSSVISVPNSTDIAAVNVPSGGVTAGIHIGTGSSAFVSLGNILAGTTVGGAGIVIDNSRNGYFANLTVSGTCTGCGSIPDASTSQRGAVSTGTQSFAGTKSFQGDVLPTVSGTYNLGTTSFRWAGLFSNSGNFAGSGAGVVTVGTSTDLAAINVPSGGVTAGIHVGTGSTASFLALGPFKVGTSIFANATIFDTAGNLFPYSNYGSNIGTSSLRYDQIYGRFLALRTNGASLGGIQSRDASNNLTFSMGDGGGTGGEFQMYTGGLSEYFGGINGQLRFNGNNGLTSSFTCPSGQAVKSMNIQNGGTITATCGIP